MANHSTRIRTLLAQLPRRTDAGPVVEAAGAALAAGDVAFVGELGAALAARCGDPRTTGYRDAFRRLFDLVASGPGPERAALAVELLAALPPGSWPDVPHQASVLAAGRPAGELASAFTVPVPERLRRCLVRELELRGDDPAEVAEIAAWAAHRRRTRRPLHLAGAAGEPALPPYGGGDGPPGAEFGPDPGSPPPRPGAPAPLPPVTETTEEDGAAAALGSATANWSTDSNGRTEARVFRFRTPLDPAAATDPSALRTLLPGLPLHCLAGTRHPARNRRNTTPHPAGPAGLAVRAAGAGQVWSLLHAAATHGGAYGPGLGDAPGRLAAWRSLAALADCPGTADTDEVESAADEYAWFTFTSDSTWFDQVAWDLGVLALSPDRRRLAVLAATDTD
ncbi:DUF6183 family protein [Kitasatospora cineracea]|uniref:DUF6183 family protein n=1 Tax=Kitasatospora cineracea TaxID=88074 RepID=UPI0034433DA4